MGEPVVVARSSRSSTASPGQVWALLGDPDTWSDWSARGAATRLSGPLRCGTRGVREARAGSAARFVVTVLVPGRSYADRTRLVGASLEQRHDVRASDGGCELSTTAELAGPLRRLYAPVLRRRLATSVPAELVRLGRAAERGPAHD